MDMDSFKKLLMSVSRDRVSDSGVFADRQYQLNYTVSLVNIQMVLDLMAEEPVVDGGGCYVRFACNGEMVSKWFSYATLSEVFEGPLSMAPIDAIIKTMPDLKSVAIDTLMNRLERMFKEALQEGTIQ